MSGARWAWRRRAPLLVAAAVFLAANAGFFLWYRGTSRQRAEGLEARRVALAAEVQAQEEEARRLERQRERLSQVSAAIGEFYGRRVGTERETLAPLVEDIHATLKRVDLAPTEISYESLPVQKLPLTQLIARFGFRADYAKFKRLVREFEGGRRWIVVREVTLARDPETPGGVEVRISLATYFTREDVEPTLPATASAGRRSAP